MHGRRHSALDTVAFSQHTDAMATDSTRFYRRQGGYDASVQPGAILLERVNGKA